MVLERSAPEVFSIVHEAVERLGWTIALSEAPGETGIGRIEATDRTLIMGFTDDVLVQVKGDDAHAIDRCPFGVALWLARSRRQCRRASAHCSTEVTTALEKGEKTVLEQAAPKEEAAEHEGRHQEARRRSAEVKNARQAR